MSEQHEQRNKDSLVHESGNENAFRPGDRMSAGPSATDTPLVQLPPLVSNISRKINSLGVKTDRLARWVIGQGSAAFAAIQTSRFPLISRSLDYLRGRGTDVAPLWRKTLDLPWFSRRRLPLKKVPTVSRLHRKQAGPTAWPEDTEYDTVSGIVHSPFSGYQEPATYDDAQPDIDVTYPMINSGLLESSTPGGLEKRTMLPVSRIPVGDGDKPVSSGIGKSPVIAQRSETGKRAEDKIPDVPAQSVRLPYIGTSKDANVQTARASERVTPAIQRNRGGSITTPTSEISARPKAVTPVTGTVPDTIQQESGPVSGPGTGNVVETDSETLPVSDINRVPDSVVYRKETTETKQDTGYRTQQLIHVQPVTPQLSRSITRPVSIPVRQVEPRPRRTVIGINDQQPPGVPGTTAPAVVHSSNGEAGTNIMRGTKAKDQKPAGIFRRPSNKAVSLGENAPQPKERISGIPARTHTPGNLVSNRIKETPGPRDTAVSWDTAAINQAAAITDTEQRRNEDTGTVYREIIPEIETVNIRKLDRQTADTSLKDTESSQRIMDNKGAETPYGAVPIPVPGSIELGTAGFVTADTRIPVRGSSVPRETASTLGSHPSLAAPLIARHVAMSPSLQRAVSGSNLKSDVPGQAETYPDLAGPVASKKGREHTETRTPSMVFPSRPRQENPLSETPGAPLKADLLTTLPEPMVSRYASLPDLALAPAAAASSAGAGREHRVEPQEIEASSTDAEPEDAPDIDAIASDVYRILKRRLMAERERALGVY